MALPSNVGHGTVTGRFIDSSGTAIEGKVRFTPTPKRLLNATANPTPVTILPKAIEVTLNDGSFTQALIATNDPDNNPTGWNYRVDFLLTGASAESFSIEVPEGSSIDLTTVTPVSSGNGTMMLRGPGVPDWSTATDGQVVVLVNGEPAWGTVTGGGGVSSWNDLTDKPSSFTPTSHTHSAADLNAGTLAIARATPGMTVTIKETSPGTYPVRGTTRTDITVMWVGTQAPTKGGNYMADHDLWLKAATA